jgi:hypothetical protein
MKTPHYPYGKKGLHLGLAKVQRNQGFGLGGNGETNGPLYPLSSPAASMSMLKHHNATAIEHLDASLLSLLMLA